MKSTTTLFMLLAFFGITFGKHIDENTAKTVGQHFITSHTGSQTSGTTAHLTLAYKAYTVNVTSTSRSQTETYYYIFNVNTNDGFIIVAGDDIVTPVLGYSSKGRYTGSNLPPAFQKWMENYKQQITYALQTNMTATDEIKSDWNTLINGTSQPNKFNLSAVGPLCSSTWDQSPYYNALCLGGSVTGCVATAMAQIMKYWAYPTTGAGFHSYNHATYGTLSANFGNTTYNWAAMPNNVSSSNTDVATLMFQCGVSVNMDYSPQSSNAYVIAADAPDCAENSYKNYFGYDPATIQGLKRVNYTDAVWKGMLKNDLDNNRPLQYAGFGSGGGHTFVCDGYDANDFFHMNWGWGGAYDGFFDLDALNPAGTGTGGGTGGFNSGQQAVIGIKPLTGGGGTTPAAIEMYSTIFVNPNPIGFAQAFTVNADVINNGTANYSGDFCAALFTSAGTLVGIIDSASTGASPLPPGYHYTGGITFSSNGVLTVPGNYIVAIFYRPAGTNWQIAGQLNYTSQVNVTISGPVNPMELYDNITPTPTTFVQGQTASVNTNFYNNTFGTYYGTYVAALYDLNGNYVETIGTYNETTGLPSGYVYNPPGITFTSPSITAAPGTYFLAILEQATGTSNYYLAGGTSYTNPVTVNVVAAALSPDAYEPNNTDVTAYTLPVTFTGNYANPTSNGSSNHIGSDYDFYKINLAAGYNYTIIARVHDSYNSGNGNIYTNDVLWSYNSAGGWSPAYDDIMPGNIIVNNGGVVLFQVAPYFAGQTGTYLLDIQITQALVGIDENTLANLINVYPVPAKDFINMDVSGFNGIVKEAALLTMQGKSLISLTDINRKENLHLSTTGIADGIYMLQLETDKGILSKKIVISR